MLRSYPHSLLPLIVIAQGFKLQLQADSVLVAINAQVIRCHADKRGNLSARECAGKGCDFVGAGHARFLTFSTGFNVCGSRSSMAQILGNSRFIASIDAARPSSLVRWKRSLMLFCSALSAVIIISCLGGRTRLSFVFFVLLVAGTGASVFQTCKRPDAMPSKLFRSRLRAAFSQ